MPVDPTVADVLAQPLAERRKLARRELCVELVGADRRLRRLGELLLRDHRAQRVRREVADGAKRPVDVLQAALRVVGDVDAEVGLHPSVPILGELVHAHLAAKERALDVVAEDDEVER